MKNFKSPSALVALLFAPCAMFGTISDVANSVIQAPIRIGKSIIGTAINTVDAVANIEHSAFDTIVASPFSKLTQLANDHSILLWRAASAASIAYIAKYGYDNYYKKCAIDRLKAKLKR